MIYFFSAKFVLYINLINVIWYIFHDIHINLLLLYITFKNTIRLINLNYETIITIS